MIVTFSFSDSFVLRRALAFGDVGMLAVGDVCRCLKKITERADLIVVRSVLRDYNIRPTIGS